MKPKPAPPSCSEEISYTTSFARSDIRERHGRKIYSLGVSFREPIDAILLTSNHGSDQLRP